MNEKIKQLIEKIKKGLKWLSWISEAISFVVNSADKFPRPPIDTTDGGEKISQVSADKPRPGNTDNVQENTKKSSGGTS